MAKNLTKNLYRVLDANFNRAKEGLRVCEDICRFWYDDPALTRRYKKIRHELTAVILDLGPAKLLQARDIAADVGKPSIPAELRRRQMKDIFYANAQRVKESMRVLEEFSKLLDPRLAQRLKKLRYQIYELERRI